MPNGQGINLFHDLPMGPQPPKKLWAVIEIAKEGRNKYEYDRENSLFKLDRVLYGAVHYPTDYGFVPQTWSQKEKDPLDVMVICTNSSFTGCVVEVRPVGLFKMIDRGIADHKVIAIATKDPRLDHIKKVSDLGPHFKKEVSNFWENYAELQPTKTIEVLGWGGVKETEAKIISEHQVYKKVFPDQ